MAEMGMSSGEQRDLDRLKAHSSAIIGGDIERESAMGLLDEDISWKAVREVVGRTIELLDQSGRITGKNNASDLGGPDDTEGDV